MVIEPRQVSPLGAPYRTPLGVFGPGVAAPPVAQWSGTVSFSSVFDVGEPVRAYLSCGTLVQVTLTVPDSPSNVYYYLDIDVTYIGGTVPPLMDRRGWYCVGQSSGATWDFGAYSTDLQSCPLNGPATWWSTAGYTSPGSVFYPDDSEAGPGPSQSVLAPFKLSLVFSGPTAGLSFSAGESVTVTNSDVSGP